MCAQTLRANGKATMKAFVLVFFPGCFLLVSLIASKFAMVIGEQVEARVAEADQKHEEFGQIVEALKRREEEVRLGFVGRDICLLPC